MRARVVALAIAAVGTAIAIIAWLQPDRTGRTASDPAPPKRTLSASPVPVERAEPPDANAAAGTSALSEQAEAQLQTAHGEIHIERGGQAPIESTSIRATDSASGCRGAADFESC